MSFRFDARDGQFLDVGCAPLTSWSFAGTSEGTILYGFEDWAPHPPFPDKPMQGKDLQGFSHWEPLWDYGSPTSVALHHCIWPKIRNGILPKLASNRKKGET